MSTEAISVTVRTTLIFIGLVLSTIVGLVAIGSGTGLIALPYEMFVLDRQMPAVFRLHMLASAFALLLAPAVIAVRRQPEYHRPLGRLLGAFVVIGGLTALPVAIFSESSAAARAGFFIQGLVWLALLGAGYAAIKRRAIARHAKLMIAMVAVTTGAVWFRLMTGTAIVLGLPFEATYALAAWLGWLVPLVLVWQMPSLTRLLLVNGPRPAASPS